MSIFYWILGVAMFADRWWPMLFRGRKPDLSDFIFPSLYLSTFGILTVLAYRTYIRLTKDSIEMRSFWRRQVLPFDKIKGRRRYTEKADPYSTPARHLVLESNNERFPRLDIKIKDSYRFDEPFYSWFDSLPDLDKLDGLEESTSKYANFSLV